MPSWQSYPILFRITQAVRCEQFEALVTTEGRALMAFEDDEWWCHGVEPGGMTEHGDGPLVAYEAFRLSFRHVLDDLAEESASIEAFQRDAQEFFNADTVEESRWEMALEELRSNSNLDEAFRNMQRMTPRPSSMTIRMLRSYADTPMPNASESDSVALPEAA